jgi:GNAT superfamily N-acetyltransferase
MARRMSVELRPARSFREVGTFIDLPFRLHAGTPWVPPLKLERRQFLSRRFGTYARRVDYELLNAYRDGRPVGRISAHIDHGYNRHHDARWGWFGFFESEDDPEVARAMLAAAEAWVRERGMDRIVGPADFTVNDESGIVIDGHEIPPVLRGPWHPPYYQALLDAAGYEKVVDMAMWRVVLEDRERGMVPMLPELARAARETHGVRIRRMSRRHLRRDLDVFAEIYNHAWRKNFGFVPYTAEDLDSYAVEMQIPFDRDWFMVAEIDGRPIAVAITLPDLNQVLRRMNGRVLPLGWWHFLRRRRIIDQVRIGFLGVKPEYRHTGAAAALYLEHFDISDRDERIKTGEAGWILEDNTAMNRGMEAMGARPVKRFRMYGREWG